MPNHVWTVEEIRNKLAVDQVWLERGVVAIFERQTNAEQRRERTIEHNRIGFSAFDAGRMSYYAKWIKGGRHLSGKHLVKARAKMMSYAGQLAKIANDELPSSQQQISMPVKPRRYSKTDAMHDLELAMDRAFAERERQQEWQALLSDADYQHA